MCPYYQKTKDKENLDDLVYGLKSWEKPIRHGLINSGKPFTEEIRVDSGRRRVTITFKYGNKTERKMFRKNLNLEGIIDKIFVDVSGKVEVSATTQIRGHASDIGLDEYLTFKVFKEPNKQTLKYKVVFSLGESTYDHNEWGEIYEDAARLKEKAKEIENYLSGKLF